MAAGGEVDPISGIFLIKFLQTQALMQILMDLMMVMCVRRKRGGV